MRRPTRGAVGFGLIPLAGMCLSVPLWDRMEPMVLGLPFNLFWLLSWIVISSGCMAAADRLEEKRDRANARATDAEEGRR